MDCGAESDLMDKSKWTGQTGTSKLCIWKMRRLDYAVYRDDEDDVDLVIADFFRRCYCSSNIRKME